mmetsp:Transcript_22163/g.58769  ORF Transcript_22163/g.58769 Transcript_22163/m.58769 type:complete len:216 (+) Transcript_22163:118-765(+)
MSQPELLFREETVRPRRVIRWLPWRELSTDQKIWVKLCQRRLQLWRKQFSRAVGRSSNISSAILAHAALDGESMHVGHVSHVDYIPQHSASLHLVEGLALQHPANTTLPTVWLVVVATQHRTQHVQWLYGHDIKTAVFICKLFRQALGVRLRHRVRKVPALGNVVSRPLTRRAFRMVTTPVLLREHVPLGSWMPHGSEGTCEHHALDAPSLLYRL